MAKNPRPFEFPHDTFAFANELVWDYYFDADGKPLADPRYIRYVPGRRLRQAADLPGDLAWALEQPFAVLEVNTRRQDDARRRQQAGSRPLQRVHRRKAS